MELMTKELTERLLEVGSQEEVEDPIVICKFFNPVGTARWFITELVSYRIWLNPDSAESEMAEIAAVDLDKYPGALIDDTIIFGFCSLFGDPLMDELGYVSLKELSSVRLPFGLTIERDIYWREKPLSEAKKEISCYK